MDTFNRFLMLVFSLVVLSSHGAQGQSATESYFQNKIYILKDLTYFFHYESAGNKQNRHQISLTNEISISEQARRFFDIESNGVDVAGPGYYVAIDPASSRMYGGENWILHMVALKKGSRILLEFDTVFGAEDHPEIVKELKEAGCETTVFGQEYYLFSYLRTSPIKSCREFVVQTIRNLKASGLGYVFRTIEYLKSCGVMPSIALNIVDTSAIDFSKTISFSQYQFHDRNLLMYESLVAELQEDSIQDPSVTGNYRTLRKAFGDDRFVFEKGFYQNWVARHIFRCDEKLEDQKGLSVNPVGPLSVRFRQIEKQYIDLDLISSASDFLRMRAFVESRSGRNRLALEQLDILTRDMASLETLNDLLNLKSLKPVRPRDFNKMITQFSSGYRRIQSTSHLSPIPVVATMKKFGVPEEVSLLYWERYYLLAKLPPLLTTIPVAQPESFYLGWIPKQASRSLLILENCLQQYTAAGAQAHLVQNGHCGFVRGPLKSINASKSVPD